MEITNKVKKLDKKYKDIFDRIYEIEEEIGTQKFPLKIKDKYKNFKKQKITIIRNKVLGLETHFNLLRSKRKKPKILQKFQEGFCVFCNPQQFTPSEDIIGKLENKYAITASNLMKATKHHGLIIFKKHKNFTIKDINGALDLSFLWFKKNKGNKFLIWNYLWKAGASIIHPHFQIFSTNKLPFRLKEIKRKFEDYKKNYGNEYLEDLFILHKKLGLAKEKNGLKVIINLTPFKENEIILIAKDWEKQKNKLSKLILKYLNIGIESFNFFLFYDGEFEKIGFLLDRGKLNELNSDIGTLEIYAFSIVSFDPFILARDLLKNF